MTEETLLEFPCVFPIKVMGKASAGFQSVILEIVRKHAPEVNEKQIKTRNSGKGNYIAITITITATSKEQLDLIYLELNACEHVNMTL